MSRPLERIVIGLARLVAGPERRLWLDAMEAELAYLPAGRRLDWALGGLVAAIKDRAPRGALALALLAALPWLAAAAVGPAFELGKVVIRAVDGPIQLALPATNLLPLVFGILLGAVHRWRRPVAAGTVAFLLHQLGPALYWSIAWRPVLVLTVADLGPLGIDDPTVMLPVMLGAALAFWCLGLWLGTRLRERLRGGRPSRR